MGLAPITACSQGDGGESSQPQASQSESKRRGRKRRRGPAGKALDDLHYPVRGPALYQCRDYVLEKYKDEVNPNVSWDHIYIADRPTYPQKIKP